MKQQSIKFLFVMLACMLGANASAHDIEVANTDGVTIYYKYLNNTELAVSCQGASAYDYPNEYIGNVVIPETVTYNKTTYSVTSILGWAFLECRDLTSVTIPNSVTSIGIEAFHGCNGLISITIPNSVTSIGEAAFLGCSGLTNIIIPNSVTSIEGSAFSGCSGLSSITLPNSITSIGIFTFYNCSNLKSITIPNSVSNIRRDAFTGTAWYNNQQDGLVYAGKVAYKYKGIMPSNTSIVLEKGTLGIGESAFSDCGDLSSITIPNSTINIGDWAFFNCSGLKSIVIPNSIINVGIGVFSGCSGLISVTIPNFVINIGNYAFQDCSNLMNVTIGNSVTSIGKKAFYGCDNITRVFSEITEPFNCGSDAFPTNACRNGTLYVPAGTKDLYIRFDGWREFLNIVEMESEDAPSDVASTRAGQATVKVVDDGVVIIHAKPQSRCVVYTSNGQQVVSTVIEGDNQKIRLQKGQVYILTINGRTLKFTL